MSVRQIVSECCSCGHAPWGGGCQPHIHTIASQPHLSGSYAVAVTQWQSHSGSHTRLRVAATSSPSQLCTYAEPGRAERADPHRRRTTPGPWHKLNPARSGSIPAGDWCGEGRCSLGV
jgi:hypothetical protein